MCCRSYMPHIKIIDQVVLIICNITCCGWMAAKTPSTTKALASDFDRRHIKRINRQMAALGFIIVGCHSKLLVHHILLLSSSEGEYGRWTLFTELHAAIKLPQPRVGSILSYDVVEVHGWFVWRWQWRRRRRE